MTEKRFDYTAYDDGTESIYDRKKDEYYFDMQLSKIEELMNELAEDNEQLKQRNTNQYNQLNELWEIIEEENWEKLIAMKKQLKEDEERLQKEWKCYE